MWRRAWRLGRLLGVEAGVEPGVLGPCQALHGCSEDCGGAVSVSADASSPA